MWLLRSGSGLQREGEGRVMITIEQAIQNIMDIKSMYTWSTGADEALDMAIQALREKAMSEEKEKEGE